MDVQKVAGFDWDDANQLKCRKHGVTIAEIEAVFAGPHHMLPDAPHSTMETRFMAIGKGQGPRPIFVIFTLRKLEGETFIRPISARYMHKKEIDRYEQEAAPSDE